MKTARARGGKLTCAVLVLGLMLGTLQNAGATVSFFGHVVQVEQLNFHPDTVNLPGDNFAVLVVQNREDAPIQHEVTSPQLFESGTLIQDRKSTRLNSSHIQKSRMPSSA